MSNNQEIRQLEKEIENLQQKLKLYQQHFRPRQILSELFWRS
ncbi:MAG: hypothetical protein UX27_C0015G0008 [Candidatus Azambacteria bacterium GW2011_GWA2_45_90]|uniref:Uncharacterized protein n=1 Tax=Candidatus Azambacteria bacterium GW2011_GWA2_45_90 TaxID=1618614 RepID=A0A0G1QMD0_9BACT|nr:MAG: hypothetical protein UX27_C0015G0008 [Candidatus Azambacteria bacterium GW2011_GWA2_45_90]